MPTRFKNSLWVGIRLKNGAAQRQGYNGFECKMRTRARGLCLNNKPLDENDCEKLECEEEASNSGTHQIRQCTSSHGFQTEPRDIMATIRFHAA